MKKEVNAIDLFKLFFAIGIVGIHSGVIRVIPSPIDYYVMKLWFRIGVPFFFIASGYFYCKKLDTHTPDENFSRAISFCSRMFLPLIVWSVLKLAKVILNDIRSNENWQSQVIIDIHNSIFYPQAGMWFISSMMIAALVISIFYKHEAVLIVLAIVCYSFALLNNSYYFLIEGTAFQNLVDAYLQYFVSARNGFFVGLPFFGTGVFIARREKQGIQFTPLQGCLLFTVFLVAYIIEIILLFGKTSADDNSIFLTSALVSGALFIITNNISMPYSISASMVMRDLSKYIFFTHSFVMTYLSFIITRITQNELIIFAHALVISSIFYLLSTKYDNKLIKKLVP